MLCQTKFGQFHVHKINLCTAFQPTVSKDFDYMLIPAILQKGIEVFGLRSNIPFRGTADSQQFPRKDFPAARPALVE